MLSPVQATKNTSIISQFDAVVERYPGGLAAKKASESIGYKRLSELSKKLASHLVDQQVKPGDRIGFLLDSSIDYLVQKRSIVVESLLAYT